METVKNLKIVQDIFRKKLPNQKFDLIELFLFSRPRNSKVFYIGKNGDGDNTLFKHSPSDDVYYDVLDKNIMYKNVDAIKVKNLAYLMKIERSDKNDN